MLSNSTDSLTSLRDTRGQGLLRTAPQPMRSGESYQRSPMGALQAWTHVVAALTASDQANAREQTERIISFIGESAFAMEHGRKREREVPAHSHGRDVELAAVRDRAGPEIER